MIAYQDANLNRPSKLGHGTWGRRNFCEAENISFAAEGYSTVRCILLFNLESILVDGTLIPHEGNQGTANPRPWALIPDGFQPFILTSRHFSIP